MLPCHAAQWQIWSGRESGAAHSCLAQLRPHVLQLRRMLRASLTLGSQLASKHSVLFKHALTPLRQRIVLPFERQCLHMASVACLAKQSPARRFVSLVWRAKLLPRMYTGAQ